MSGSAAERVMQYIRQQKLVAGDRLPAEVDISRMLGLSRNSLREAYADLMAKGLLKSKHGIGTFIANPPILNALTGSAGFWNLIEKAGMKASFREILRDQVSAPKEIAVIFGLAAENPTERLRWLFLANDQPCILVDHYLARGIPTSAFNETTEPVDKSNSPEIINRPIGIAMMPSSAAVLSQPAVPGMVRKPLAPPTMPKKM